MRSDLSQVIEHIERILFVRHISSRYAFRGTEIQTLLLDGDANKSEEIQAP